MAYMCLDCYEVFEENVMRSAKRVSYDNGEWIDCPKVKCIGNVIEVDELILPIVKILNVKGYDTRYCCAGHAYDNCPNTYINFESDVEIPSLPQGFKFDETKINGGVTIRKNYDEFKNKEVVLFKEIAKSVIDLLDWAVGLPENIEE